MNEKMNEKMDEELQEKLKKMISRVVSFSLKQMDGKFGLPEMLEATLQIYAQILVTLLRSAIKQENLTIEKCMEIYDISANGIVTHFRELVEERLKNEAGIGGVRNEE